MLKSYSTAIALALSKISDRLLKSFEFCSGSYPGYHLLRSKLLYILYII